MPPPFPAISPHRRPLPRSSGTFALVNLTVPLSCPAQAPCLIWRSHRIIRITWRGGKWGDQVKSWKESGVRIRNARVRSPPVRSGVTRNHLRTSTAADIVLSMESSAFGNFTVRRFYRMHFEAFKNSWKEKREGELLRAIVPGHGPQILHRVEFIDRWWSPAFGLS